MGRGLERVERSLEDTVLKPFGEAVFELQAFCGDGPRVSHFCSVWMWSRLFGEVTLQETVEGERRGAHMVARSLWSRRLPALTSILWVLGPAKAILFGSWRMHRLSGGLHVRGKGREVLTAAQTMFRSAPGRSVAPGLPPTNVCILCMIHPDSIANVGNKVGLLFIYPVNPQLALTAEHENK